MIKNRISLRRVGLIALIIVLVLLFSLCGISTRAYIYPPIYEGTDLTFRHDYRNNKDPNFATLGYDIYYRIYDNSDEVLDSTITSDANNFFTSSNKLISRNIEADSLYRPLKDVSNDKGYSYSPPPFLPIDNSIVTDESFYITILLNDTNSENPYIETQAPYASITLPEKIFFQRYIDSDENKDFSEFSGEDSDVPDSLDGKKVTVAFFVVSYGFTVELSSFTSDKVVYIGRTDIGE